MIIDKPNTKKVTHSLSREVLDSETGEILHSERTITSILPKEPPYVKIYLEDIARLTGLPPTASKVLNVLIRNMSYNNMIPMLKPFKEVICSAIDIKMNTLEKVIGQLEEAGIIHRFARGLYFLDPNLFAKGTWENIQKLRLVIEYDQNGKRVLSSNAPEQMKQLAIKFD